MVGQIEFGVEQLGHAHFDRHRPSAGDNDFQATLRVHGEGLGAALAERQTRLRVKRAGQASQRDTENRNGDGGGTTDSGTGTRLWRCRRSRPFPSRPGGGTSVPTPLYAPSLTASPPTGRGR